MDSEGNVKTIPLAFEGNKQRRSKLEISGAAWSGEIGKKREVAPCKLQVKEADRPSNEVFE